MQGTFLTGRTVARAMAAQGSGGSIVNMSSVNASLVIPGMSGYVSSKGGVQQLTRLMAIELAPFGIRVNCVCPGATLTPLLQESIDTAPDPEARRRLLDGTTLMRRVGRPEEIANVALFLASPLASWVTGQAIAVAAMFAPRHQRSNSKTRRRTKDLSIWRVDWL